MYRVPTEIEYVCLQLFMPHDFIERRRKYYTIQAHALKSIYTCSEVCPEHYFTRGLMTTRKAQRFRSNFLWPEVYSPEHCNTVSSILMEDCWCS